MKLKLAINQFFAYILQGSEFVFEKEIRSFFLKFNFNCKSFNLMYVVICCYCQQEYLGQTGTLLREKISVCKQHINHRQYQVIRMEEHIRNCGKVKSIVIPLFQVKKESKALREVYEDPFIKISNPLLIRAYNVIQYYVNYILAIFISSYTS